MPTGRPFAEALGQHLAAATDESGLHFRTAEIHSEDEVPWRLRCIRGVSIRR